MMPTVVVPFLNARERDHIQFNKIHSGTRMVIEHAFGALVLRWRTLWKHLYMLDVARMTKVIYACCVLHNICLSMDDEEEEDLEEVGRIEAFVDMDNREQEGYNVEVLPISENQISDDNLPPVPTFSYQDIDPNVRIDIGIRRVNNHLREAGRETRNQLMQHVLGTSLTTAGNSTLTQQ